MLAFERLSYLCWNEENSLCRKLSLIDLHFALPASSIEPMLHGVYWIFHTESYFTRFWFEVISFIISLNALLHVIEIELCMLGHVLWLP